MIVAEVCVQAYASFSEYINRKLCILKCEFFDFQDIKTLPEYPRMSCEHQVGILRDLGNLFRQAELLQCRLRKEGMQL